MTEQAGIPAAEDNPHLPVHLAVRAVQTLFWRHWDIPDAWPLLDPVLRRCWVQHWLCTMPGTEEFGDREEITEALIVDQPRHRRWALFTAAAVELLDVAFPPGIAGWIPAAEPDPFALGIERLDLLPPPARPDEAVPEGSPCLAFLVQHTDGVGWRVLNFGSLLVPEPGWPPTW